MRSFWRRRRSGILLTYSLLAEEDGLSGTSRQSAELDTLTAKFGRSLLNASPKDISKLKAATESDDAEEILEIVGRQDASTNPTNNESEFISIDISQDSLFKMAVDDCKTEWVKFFLKKIGDKSIPFDISASMMKESFNKLWLDYRFLAEDMIKKDVFGWDICAIEVPIETFTVECNMGIRVGTCNTISEWLMASRMGFGFLHWNSLNSNGVDKVLKMSRGRKVNAIVRIYCFENACQVGLDGIIRYLLMRKAPSSLFKTPLLKWVITFKWERIWKVHAFKRLASFLVLFIGFHILVLFASIEDFFPIPEAAETVLFCFCTITFVLLPTLILRREYFQLKRCILDCQKIFPSKPFRGIRNYFGSRPNQIDLMISGHILLMFAALGLVMAKTYVKFARIVFVSALATGVLFMWAKAFYLTQAFKKSGIYVVMIGRVLRECRPYFLLLFFITIGFGLAMRVAFLGFYWAHNDVNADSLSRHESEKLLYINQTFLTLKEVFQNETAEISIENFGTLYKSILTMTYAMVGLFEPEVLLHCGSLKVLMIALFVVYLLLQTIVMFNMLIASMGDAFDGVRAAEEELFLMARATFIDQYEASLSNKAIQKTNGRTGKYLYVLVPEDKQLEEDVSFWKGRIPTIKEDVTKILTDSQSQQSQNMNEMLKTLREDINNDMKRQEERISGILEERIAKILEEKMMLLEQRINAQNASL